jgi:triosephosphate isomerase
MSTTICAANWKMHHGPTAAGEFLDRFLASYEPLPGREVWLFPPAVSLEGVARRIAGQPSLRVGAQNAHWEAAGAFTGELSPPMARDAGATALLVGHSERRHVFGETDADTERKVRAALEAGLVPVLCVGEQLEEREAGNTLNVVHRQLGAVGDLGADDLAGIVVAYEPVWAIGTGKNATPSDAAAVHAAIHEWLQERGVARDTVPVLYGGSVKPGNAAELLGEPAINGVLVGGASLDPESWQAICRAGLD